MLSLLIKYIPQKKKKLTGFVKCFKTRNQPSSHSQ